MRLKFTKLTILLLGIVLLFSGCAGKTAEKNIAGMYIYEKDISSGNFDIIIYEDGTYYYGEGAFSYTGHFRHGNWTLESDTLILTDENESSENDEICVNYFKLDGDNLVFKEENSSNFIYAKVADGEKFLLYKENE